MALTDLASALFTQTTENRSEIMITGLRPTDDTPQETFVFQHFPEAVADNKAINQQQKEVPGGTLPIYQWISSGERTISFTAVFTTDVDLLAQGINKAAEVYQRIEGAGLTRHNVDVRTALAYLRTFMFPTYGNDAGLGVPVTMPPRKIRLTIPRSGLGLMGGAGNGTVTPDSIICVMTQCDFNIVQYFPSGLPRIAEVSLAFAQTAQVGGQVNFPASALDLLQVGASYGQVSNALSGLADTVGLGGLFGGGDGAGRNTQVAAMGLQPYTLQPRKLKE